MSKSILIVICDFLLLSMLALARFEAVDQEQRPPAGRPPTPGYSSGEQDLVDVLKLALAQEKKTREQLLAELDAARGNLEAQQQALGLREQQVQALQQRVSEKELLGQQLAQQRTNLQLQVSAAQENLELLRRQVETVTTERLLSQEQQKALEAQLRKKEEELAATRQRIDQLEALRQRAQTEKLELAAQLQVAEAEKRLVTEQVSSLRQEVQVVRQEKEQIQEQATQLAENIGQIAEKSSALTQEIRENRALAANTIFHEFATNRVTARFLARRSGLLGAQVNADRITQTILAAQDTNYFALCHLTDTPLDFSTPGLGWESFQVLLSRGHAVVPATRVVFASADPRIILIPLNKEEAEALGAKIYRLAEDPFRFQEAVLVGASEGYYGECKFQIDLSTPSYVRMDRSLFRVFSGKFNPSRGDVVLSKTGELLGLMANNRYCVQLRGLGAYAQIVCSDKASPKSMAQLLSDLHGVTLRMPYRLQ